VGDLIHRAVASGDDDELASIRRCLTGEVRGVAGALRRLFVEADSFGPQRSLDVFDATRVRVERQF